MEKNINGLDERVDKVVEKFKDFSKEIPRNDYEIRRYYETIYKASKKAIEVNKALEDENEEEKNLSKMLESIENTFNAYYFDKKN